MTIRRAIDSRSVACITLMILLCGCRTQGLLPVHTNGVVLSEYPTGARLVEKRVNEDVILRGVYVPAGEGAPLVVSFQATGRSVAPPENDDVYISIAPLTRHLQGLGLSSLVFDYPGVGVSTGRRDSQNLPESALAMWENAMALVDGRPEQVVLRGTSLGTLAVASLLDSEVTVAGAVLISPIRAETVARNAGIVKFGTVLTRMVAPFLTSIAPVDIAEVLSRTETHVIVIASPNDAFLPRGEQETLRGAIRDELVWVQSSRGLGRDSDPFFAHVIVAGMNERIPDPLEIKWYRSRYQLGAALQRRTSAFMDAVPAEYRRALSDKEWVGRLERVATRFHPNTKSLASAIALEGPEQPVEKYASWLYNLPRRVVEELDFTHARHLVRLEDPAGDIRLDWLEQLSVLFSVYKRVMDPVEVLEIYREYSCSGSPDLPRRTGSAADDVLHEKLLEIRGVISEGIPLVDPAPRRVLLRLLAKSNGIPDRQAPDLAAKTELYFDGRWNGIGSTDPPCRQGH